jgi:cell division septum initiation protein DivIVA
MGNNTKPQLTIDGVEYDVEKFTDQQKMLLEHVVDLDRKVNSARFNLDQLQVGKDSFFNLLKQSLAEAPADVENKLETAE